MKFELVDVHFKWKNLSCCHRSFISESVVSDFVFALEDEILHDIEGKKVAGVDVSCQAERTVKTVVYSDFIL